MKINPDPRVKLLIVMFLSTVVIFYQNIWTLLAVTVLTLLVGWTMDVEILKVLRKLRHFLMLLAGIIIVQSIFRNDGQAIISIGGVTLLTDVGINMAIGYFCRVVVIIYSGAIIGTSTLRQNLQALTQIGIPFELALMTGVGIRFLPMLMEEVSNAYLAMALRGVEVGALPIRKRVTLVSQLFIPIIYSTLTRAQKLSESIEARGFIIGQKRSSYYRLKFNKNDWMISVLGLVIFVVVVWLNRGY